MSETFYSEMKAFSDYSGIFVSENYKPAPSDWLLVTTDIKNSTVAVEAGKYKDVNLIGAACIGAVKVHGDYPFVFGGDGASFLIPPSIVEQVKDELIRIKNSAKRRYDLVLRVGVVPVTEIIKTKHLNVAKFELTNGCYVAEFSGGGIEYADSLIKSDSRYLLESKSTEESSFEGVTCRWNPILSTQGIILTLIIKTNYFSQYREVQNSLDKILGKNESRINPIKIGEMSYMGLIEMYQSEKTRNREFFSIESLRHKIGILFVYFYFKIFRNYMPKFIADYTASIEAHSDFRKFDDSLRMVIDCSEKEKTKIFEELDKVEDLEYGYSISDYALMTCLVFGLDEGEHIHFVDGQGGGYTNAAKMIKGAEKLD